MSAFWHAAPKADLPLRPKQVFSRIRSNVRFPPKADIPLSSEADQSLAAALGAKQTFPLMAFA
jgi:hypothetical protein